MAMYSRYPAERGTGDLWTTIKRNPVPSALAAIGLGLLWTNRASGSQGPQRSSDSRPRHDRGETHSGWSARSPSTGSRYDASGTEADRDNQSGGQGQQIGEQVIGQAQHMGEQFVEQVQQMGEQVQEVSGQVTGQVQDTAGQMQLQVHERAGQMRQQAHGFRQMLEANPVAMGALGSVLGGFAGLLVPKSEKERTLLGETRERVVSNVQEIVGETAARAQRVAEEAGKSAIEAGAAALDELNSEPSATGKRNTGKTGTGKRGGEKRGKGKRGG